MLALLGVMSTDANENGPLTTLEQSMIGQAPAATRLRVFGRYNAVAYLAGRARGAARGRPRVRPPVLDRDPDRARLVPALPARRGRSACCWRAVSPPTLERSAAAHAGRRWIGRAPTVTKLAALFAVDAFAGGFVITVFIVYWFSTEFGASRS